MWNVSCKGLILLQGCIGSSGFWTSDEHEMTRRLSPAVARRTRPAPKKKNKKEQPFLSCHLQPSSCCGQGMVSHWTSSCCGQGLVVSYWTSSSCGHLRQRSLKEPFATLFSAAIFSHHLAVVRPWSAIEHHLAVVRGWWSAIEHHLLVAIYDNVLWKNPLLRFSQLPCSAIILLWSGVGGQLLNILFLWPSMTAFCERTLSGKNKPVKSSANVFCMYLA